MLGAAMGAMGGRRAGCAAVAGLALLLAGCGNDRGQAFSMPPGTEFDAAAAARVLVVVESQNMCADLGACAQPDAAPCHVGEGNTRGLAVYRLGTSGRLFSATGDRSGAQPEQVIATDDNPRRVIAHPDDPTLLYVATLDRVQVFRLGAAGATRCIDETPSDPEIDPGADELDPIDLAIDPAFGEHGVLYVAASGAGRVDAYEIAADGTLPALPTSCIVGPTEAEYSAITPVTAGLFATGGRNRIEIWERVDGQFPDVQSPPTPTPTPTADGGAPTASPTPDPSVPTETATPTPAPTCVGARLVSSPLSALGAGLVTDIEFLPSATEPAGNLIVTEEVTRRLTSFPVDPNGEIDDDDDGRTDRSGLYQRILRAERSGQTFLYATVFQEGRTDVFRLEEDGRLPDSNLAKTRSDPFSLPVGLALDGDDGPILWVAQEGLGRVDGFLVRDDGGIENVPTTSTPPVQRPTGGEVDTFPDDVVVVPLP